MENLPKLVEHLQRRFATMHDALESDIEQGRIPAHEMKASNILLLSMDILQNLNLRSVASAQETNENKGKNECNARYRAMVLEALSIVDPANPMQLAMKANTYKKQIANDTKLLDAMAALKYKIEEVEHSLPETTPSLQARRKLARAEMAPLGDPNRHVHYTITSLDGKMTGSRSRSPFVRAYAEIISEENKTNNQRSR